MAAPCSAAIASADCVLVLGAGLNSFTTFRGDLLRNKAVIRCDTDPMAPQPEHGVSVNIDVCADGADFAEAILSLLLEGDVAPRTEWWSQLGGTSAETCAPEQAPLSQFLNALDRLIPEDRLVVVDSGRFMVEVMKRIQTQRPEDFVLMCNFGSIGLGTAAGVGATFAAGGRSTVAFVGDGGFMMGGLAEFNTAVRYQRDLIVVVCNDNSYGAEYQVLREDGMATALSEFVWPSFTEIAGSLGGVGLTIRNADDFPKLAHAIATGQRPLLVELVLDPSDVPDVVH